jgi:hypothetical protein
LNLGWLGPGLSCRGNWPDDLLSSSDRYPPGNREGDGQGYGEGNEESDSDRNGLSNPQGNG